MKAQRTHFRGCAFRRFFVEISEDDARARHGQRFRRLPAYPASAPCDDRDAAVETHQVPNIHHATLRRAGDLREPPSILLALECAKLRKVCVAPLL